MPEVARLQSEAAVETAQTRIPAEAAGQLAEMAELQNLSEEKRKAREEARGAMSKELDKQLATAIADFGPLGGDTTQAMAPQL